MDTKQQILQLTKQYYEETFATKKDVPFQEGDRVTYAARVFDEEELLNLIDSSLEFWLTSGRYTDAFEKGLAEYELYFQGGESVCVTVFGHAVDAFESTTQGGACFRCIVNGKMGYASTERCCEDEARAIVDRAMDNAAVLESEEQVFLTPGGLSYEEADPASYELPTTHMLIQKALELQEKQYAAHPAVVDGTSVRTVVETSTVAISNSLGLNLSYKAQLAAALAEAVTEKDGEKATHHKILVGDLTAMDLGAVA